jgi:hydroxyacylglutathione hydrolase
VPSLRAAVIPVTVFQQNCTLLWSESTKKGAVVDPGGDLHRVMDALEATGIEVEKILLTHGHIDHAGGAAELKDRLGVPIEGPMSRTASCSSASSIRVGLPGSRDRET